MPINWYPGHMHKANKEMARLINDIDVVLEVLDARMPAASSNPRIREIRGDKPCLHILNKADLADPDHTHTWLSWYNRRPGSRAIASDHRNSPDKTDIIRECEILLARQAADGQLPSRKRQIMIVGIPNVGKSTLMNRILGRKVAKTGNEPAVTKGQQRIRLSDNWYLYDTPGVLWPKLEDQAAAYRLACAGAIRNTAVEAEDVAFFAAEMLARDFPETLQQRYQLEQVAADAETTLADIAKRRGCLRKSGQVDWHKVSTLLLNDYRGGQLGRMTLELPPVETAVKANDSDTLNNTDINSVPNQEKNA